ncbi:MAG: ligase-associated DNA damage response DEXH box helicase [Bacteroidetes bacterium]|nr:ligase-associated DNA damage response DEXH box helicase [Bacteroidota bacterium]
MKLQATKGYKIIKEWMQSRQMTPFEFQEETWEAIAKNKSGIVNAPTGCGKTFSVFLGLLIHYINQYPDSYQHRKNIGLQLLWISPLRALAKDIGNSMQQMLNEAGIPWKVGIRNGDTSTSERLKQKKQIPEILITTPESLHLLLAQKGYPQLFSTLQLVAVDEWHELFGSKRGVQVELALSRIKGLLRDIQKDCSIWGISATIGNLDEAAEVLLVAHVADKNSSQFIRAKLDKKIKVSSIIPDDLTKYPWAGHVGLSLIHHVISIIESSESTLIFINTRGMSERWYQEILNHAPSLAGQIALHHGSIDPELRNWVEDALHQHKLKAVVCTASLDLGVDFRPVDTVIQVGSPKGISRFLQRAGRSGHQPNATSHIYFLPTHALELMESVALQEAIKENLAEHKDPLVLCADVLLQYLQTLAISEGFEPEQIIKEIQSTYCYQHITPEEWHHLLSFLVHGGKALQEYDDYQKVIIENGIYRIKSRKLAMRHRMNIGTIVSEQMLKVKFQNGGYIGMIEEWFISKLEPGDSFIIAGQKVALVQIKEMMVYVKKSNAAKSIVPSWLGGRMSLSANLGEKLRQTFQSVLHDPLNYPEFKHLAELMELQKNRSHIPGDQELLIEQHQSKEGYHLLVYPFEGRQLHEALSALLAYRIGKFKNISFSIAMNDYGFELLSDQPIPVDATNVKALFSDEHLFEDIQKSVNATEMAKRKFRDIAVIGGLIFQVLPGQQKKAKHLQASAGLLFNVFSEYDPENPLLRQAFQEVFEQQMEERRLRAALKRIRESQIIITHPERFTPMSFPIIADGLNRNNLSTEKLAERIKRMQEQLLGR